MDLTDLGSYVTLPVDADTLLTDALASQLIDLSALSNGLQGYLQLLNQALALADTAGKIPVVGGDIQQGLDFINGVKQAIESVIPVDGTSQKVTDSTAIQAALDAIGAKLPVAPDFSVAATCNATLDAPQNLRDDGSVIGGSPDTDYSYRVVAVRDSNTTGTSPASNVLPIKNVAVSTTNPNKIAWDPSEWATGYRVDRKVGTGAWHTLTTVVGHDTTHYTDDGTDTPASAPAADPPTTAPTLSPCPGAAITGFTVKAVIGQGDPSSTGCTDVDTTNTCVTAASRPLDLGLPGLSVSTTDPEHANTGGVQATVGWKLHLSFGLSKTDGFVVYTQDNDSPASHPTNANSTPELVVGGALVAPKEFNGRLAFLSMQAADTQDGTGETTNRSFTGAFSVDLHAPGATACPVSGCALDTGQKLTVHDILTADASSMITATLQAAVHLHYQLTVRSDAPLPGIRTDFHLDWSWSSGTSPDETSGLQIGFDDVRINPGTFLGSVLQPIFDKINALYGPVKPVLDTVSAPLPVLSDLSHLAGGGDVSILTLAATFASGTGNADTFNQFVGIFTSVKDVLSALNAATSACGSGDDYCIVLGSFDMDPSKTFSQQNTPDTAGGLLSSPDTSGHDSLFDQLNGKVDGALSHAEAAASGGGSTNACGAAGDARGFSFTAFKDPASLFGLLLGKDIELVCFDSGPLTLSFTMSESFGPVYAPPPVLIVISGSASVSAHIVAGFDTYGIRKAVEASDAGTLARSVDFLDSLYFKTVDSSGHPIPVLQFQGTLAAGAAVSAVIITVGVEGGITLTVGFFWNDPDNDGKFRFSEFLATALKNPICLFNVGGELDLFLKVFITIGFSPFDVSFDFTLVNIKLLDFSIKPDCTPPPPELAGKAGDGTLYLFAGRLGTEDLRGDSFYANGGTDKEKVVVRQHGDPGASPATVTVQMLGITEDFSGVTRVVLDGKDYGGPIQALFQGAGDASAGKNSDFTLPTVIVGGNEADVIKTGSGPTWIDGGGGDDQITTGDRPDLSVSGQPAVVTGGDGNDNISVGNADDTVYGDGDLVIPDTTAPGPELSLNTGATKHAVTLNWNSIDPPSDGDTGSGNDRISVGLGHDQIWGGGGDDVVGVAADSPLADLAGVTDPDQYRSQGVTVHGGPGSDRVSGGSGDDVIFTGDTFTPGSDQDAIADRTTASGDGGTTNTVDTGTGSDTVYGSNGSDLVTGHSAGTAFDTFYGGPGQDILMGGYGQDKLFGGPDNDYLIAEPSTVGASRLHLRRPGVGAHRRTHPDDGDGAAQADGRRRGRGPDLRR